MFTGLIEEVGTILDLKSNGDSMVLTIGCKHVLQDAAVGDSIAIDGICLTVTELHENAFVADAIPETVERTHLPTIRLGAKVNLERAMAMGDRLGGHLVQGHVDGTAKLIEKKARGTEVLFRFQIEPSFTRYMIEKGSITINGISLTLVEATETTFAVSIIPHTLEVTNMGQLSIGDSVNIECDLLGKYIAKLISKTEPIPTSFSVEQMQ
ncbi:riboflavin synthase alpha chain [Seinonella peptonophila]|uniref:Riboflavin synthase n=1 Tax=Seinonella peptonophila TaxID=112248 RepID=A0A1M4Z3P1_9BACL|nr:riboflavin synthase [Seinonella peptonophila]SHF12651.1 riboflavin synthase alpha chain [Seinonella peptonophila]